MTLVLSLILVACYSVLNRLRGNATVPKIVAYALFAVLLCLNATLNGAILSPAQYVALFLLGWAGTYWGYAHCWGKYFPTLTDTSAQTCVPVVDKLTTMLCGPYTSETPDDQVLRWKTVAMSIRYLIFFTPKYLAIAAFMLSCNVHDNLQALLGLATAVLLLALAGPTYRLGFWLSYQKPEWNQYNVAFSELMIGAEFAVADAMST